MFQFSCSCERRPEKVVQLLDFRSLDLDFILAPRLCKSPANSSVPDVSVRKNSHKEPCLSSVGVGKMEVGSGWVQGVGKLAGRKTASCEMFLGFCWLWLGRFRAFFTEMLPTSAAGQRPEEPVYPANHDLVTSIIISSRRGEHTATRDQAPPFCSHPSRPRFLRKLGSAAVPLSPCQRLIKQVLR